jgi:Uma2 family endonuclease
MPKVAQRSAWEHALRDPALQDLPYKIETNEYDQLVLSPHKPYHSVQQSDVYDALKDRMDRPGRPVQEFAIQTSGGIKVADVVWISEERLQQIPSGASASPVAPEICVEVLSEGNTEAEIDEKRVLYVEAGAQEVWTCDENGQMTFYGADGVLERSNLVPTFPVQIGDD